MNKKNLINGRGYILSYHPDNPNCHKTGYMYEHRFVMEQYIKRYLKKTEIVHHINSNKQDNRIENLFICLSVKQHRNLNEEKRNYFHIETDRDRLIKETIKDIKNYVISRQY